MKFNYWDRVRLLCKLDADGGNGGGTGSSGEGNPDDKGGNAGGADGGSNDKTFTQEQVNSMIAAEKRKNLSSMYKGLGFEHDGIRRRYYQDGEDAYTMARHEAPASEG